MFRANGSAAPRKPRLSQLVAAAVFAFVPIGSRSTSGQGASMNMQSKSIDQEKQNKKE
jgi:hypothetical protein